MPYMVNGCGTSFCAGRGLTKWGGEADCDGTECFVLLCLPIFPYKAVHTFKWDGNQYHHIPIKWSFAVVAMSWLRRWMWGFIIFGVVMAVVTAVDLFEGKHSSHKAAPMFGAMAAVGLVVGGGLWAGLNACDKRPRAIRRILGQHSYGSSDPATWKGALEESVKSAQEFCSNSSFAAGVSMYLGRGEIHRAMWCARLTVLKEDPAEGERLTDEILQDSRTVDALEEIEKDLTRWAELLGVKA